MKKISIAIALAFLLAIFPSCTKQKSADSTLKIVTTIFPEYDWVRQILGENAGHAELTLLLDNGVDLHSYQPTVQDMAKLSSADIFIYVGGESDGWVTDALKTVKNKSMTAINLLEILGENAKTEEIIEGMQAEDDTADTNDDDDEIEYDEHVWLSLRNARRFCEAITIALCEKDEAHAAAYKANCAAYDKTLAALDEKYSAKVASAANKTLLFGDRFPFRYLIDDYGLQYYAAFSGCSAEIEASFKTVAFLSAKADELKLSAVIQLEKSDGKIARTIIQNTKAKNARIINLDSMQSVTGEDIAAGATYAGIMERNLEALEEALKEIL